MRRSDNHPASGLSGRTQAAMAGEQDGYNLLLCFVRSVWRQRQQCAMILSAITYTHRVCPLAPQKQRAKRAENGKTI